MSSVRFEKLKSSATAVALATFAVVAMIGASAPNSHAQVPTPNVLYGFQQESTDVIAPVGPIAQGRDGNFYGTGTGRGANFKGGVFRITPAGREQLLASYDNNFTAGSCLGLILGMDGNFYGTCFGGGANAAGLFYRVTPAGVITDLHDFTQANAGVQGAPVLGADGNFYGTTSAEFYRITPAGVYTTLSTLPTGDSVPSVLNAGSDGNFYGTVADATGFGNQGGVFKLTPKGVFSLIHGFDPTGPVGIGPSIGITMGSDGKLYGTTSGGGPTGEGYIYRMTPAGGAVTALHNIDNIADGDNGTGGNGEVSEELILRASDGNLYLANQGGGIANEGGVAELTAANAFSVFLFGTLDPPTDGSQPSGPLMQHTNGTIYGIAASNGPQFADGTFFSMKIGASPFLALVTPVPAGKETTSVEILGQGFNSTSKVKFGGTLASTIALTGTTFIKATVPSGALTGKITVTTGSTTLSTLVNYRITPTIGSFSPTSGSVGTPVTITGTGLKQATKVTFNGVSATFTANSDQQITTSVPAGATTGKIAVTTPGGAATSTATFTVH